MKVVDNKTAKKFIKDLKKLNKNINFETIKYRDSIILIDNFNASKINLPNGWSYDARLGFICGDINDMYYIRTSVIELEQVNDIEDLAREMQRVNPTAQIRVDYYSSSEPKLVSSMGLENLNYPDGFYYNEKNGLTNKHNTKDGLYLSVEVEQVDSQINDNLKLLSELQTLNPSANIKIEPIALMNGDLSTISSNISADKLVLPEGFEYNEKNGITNKHNTTSGAYISCKVEQNEIKDAYDMAREIIDLNANVKVQISNSNGQPVIKTSEDIRNLQLPKDFIYHNNQIFGREGTGNLIIAYEPPKKNIIGQAKDLVEHAKDKIEETVASVKGSVAKKKALKELNPMEFSDIKEYFDKYTMGTKNGKPIAIDRKTDKVVKDEEVVSKVQFACAWVDACGKNLSLTGNEVLEGVDERQYEYAFNEGAEQTFNSLVEYIRFNLGGKVNLEDMSEHAKGETGYKYADSIVEGLFENHTPDKLKIIKSELSKSAQASQMKNSITNIK